MAITQFKRESDGLVATVTYRDDVDETMVTIGSESGQQLYQDVPEFVEFDNPEAAAAEVFGRYDELRGIPAGPYGRNASALRQLPRLRLVA